MPHRVLQGLPVVCPFYHLYSWPEEKATGLVQGASRAREAGERGKLFPRVDSRAQRDGVISLLGGSPAPVG